KASDLRARPWPRLLRCTDGACHCARRPQQGLSFLGAHHRRDQEHAIPDAEDPMIIKKRALPRRTFLRGVGVTLSLPLLDAMFPALSSTAAAATNPVRRLGFVYIPMGMSPAEWTPAGEGKLTTLSPSLASLEPFLDHITVLTNTELKDMAYPTG